MLHKVIWSAKEKYSTMKVMLSLSGQAWYNNCKKCHDFLHIDKTVTKIDDRQVTSKTERGRKSNFALHHSEHKQLTQIILPQQAH